MICPHYPVKISILPLVYNQPHVYDHKSQSFTSCDSNNNDGIFKNTNSISSINNQSNLGIFDPMAILYENCMGMIRQNYCLDDCNGSGVHLNTSSSGNNGSDDNQRFGRSASQTNFKFGQMINDSNTSSNRNS